MKELNSENPEMVSGCMDELWKEEVRYKTELATIWKKCVNFSNGDQRNDSGAAPIIVNNQFVSPQQSGRDRAYQTNEIEPLIRTIVSYMTRAKPAVEVNPNDRTEKGRSRARLGDKFLEAKYDLDDEYSNSQMSAYWALNVGTIFGKDFWDAGAGTQIDVPVLDQDGQPMLDAGGQPVMRKRRIGLNDTAILTPFTVSTDHSVTNFKQIPWIQEAYMADLEWAEASFNREGDGYLGFKSSDDDFDMGQPMQTFEELKYSVPYQGSVQPPKRKDQVFVRELYVKPSEAFPSGRLIIKVGKKIVFMDASPYFLPYDKVIWHPYTMFGFEPYVGRLLYKSLTEQLIPIQMRINELNGAFLENANTIAKPWVLAAERQLKRGVISGGGPKVMTYKPRPDAGPPAFMNGKPLPAQFFQERQSLIETMVRIAGTNFVMQGTPPPGVSAAAAIQQLLENANTQHSDLMNSWEKFHEQRFNKKLRIFRKFADVPDSGLVDYMRTISKDSLDHEINDFIGEDIGDGLMVKIESGSMIPKSEKFRRELYKEFAIEGILGPVNEDSPRGARLRNELLSKFGEKGFGSEINADIEKAQWENERMKRGLPVEVWDKDNHDIHLSELYSEMKRPKFLETASDAVKSAYQSHADEHEAMKQQMAMEQIAQQVLTPESEAMAQGGIPPEVTAEAPAMVQ